MSNRCVEKTITFLYSNSDTLVPVKTVQLGEPANITCALPNVVSSSGVHWYKQSVGDTLKLIVSLYERAAPQYGQEIFKSRFQAHYDKKFSNLTILKAVQDDEGIYHCGMIEWINPEWTGTYLLVKGKLVIHCHTFIHFKLRHLLQPFPHLDNIRDNIDTDEELNYAALHFSERKTRRKRKTEFAEDSVYSQVKR
uniref:Ig-like domain-containing protein n=1 Tax=Oreochromis aureus TaxID=47969 RepID=A0A668SBS3_OREAU